MVARVVSVLRASCAVCGIVCVLYASTSKHAQGLGKGIGAGWLAVCFVGGAKAALSLALSLSLFFLPLRVCMGCTCTVRAEYEYSGTCIFSAILDVRLEQGWRCRCKCLTQGLLLLGDFPGGVRALLSGKDGRPNGASVPVALPSNLSTRASQRRRCGDAADSMELVLRRRSHRPSRFDG